MLKKLKHTLQYLLLEDDDPLLKISNCIPYYFVSVGERSEEKKRKIIINPEQTQRQSLCDFHSVQYLDVGCKNNTEGISSSTV